MNKKKKSYLIYHPLILAIYPLLFFYSNNQSELKIGVIITPIIISLVCSSVLWLLARLVLRNWRTSGIFVSLILFIFFSYGHVAILLKNVFIPIGSEIIIGPHKILLPLFGLLIGFVFLKLFKSKSGWFSLNKLLNIILLTLLLGQVFLILKQEKDVVKKSNVADQEKMVEVKDLDNDTPDIYYIILDAYARADILEELYEYDNSEFIERLEKLGFFVSDEASSNYSQTFLSLSSSLNMEYVNYFTDQLGKDSRSSNLAHDMIGDSSVTRFLKERGYKIINFASGWGPTDRMVAADINYMNTNTFEFLGQRLDLNEFYIVFLQTTALTPFIQDPLIDQARSNVLYAFDKLTEIPYQRDKKMVIAHFNSPHPPYLFDENGEEIPETVLEMAGESFSDRENYLKQLKFVNKRIADTLEKIIERSQEKPLIVLQADHGPASILGHPHKWTRPPSSEGIKERLSILYAYYNPKGNDLFGEKTTPVNTFRLIFDRYFETEYGRLDDASYFSDYNNMYEFFEITDNLGVGE